MTTPNSPPRADRGTYPIASHSVFKVKTTVNINDYVWVKLTSYALSCIPANELKQLVIDENGWARFQLWVLMSTFGAHLFNGCEQLFHDNQIKFDAPAPVPVASDTRYEFSVCDENYTEQAGGSAPTYAQALSEGQHYLAQYLQDGPHLLELRRVEVLVLDALPHPQPQSTPTPTP